MQSEVIHNIRSKFNLVFVVAICAGCGAAPLYQEVDAQQATIEDSDELQVFSQGEVQRDKFGRVESIKGFEKSDSLSDLSDSSAGYTALEDLRSSEEPIFNFETGEGRNAEFSEPRFQHPQMVGAAPLRLSEFSQTCESLQYSEKEPTIGTVLKVAEDSGRCGKIRFEFCIKMSLEGFEGYQFILSPPISIPIPCAKESFKDAKVVIDGGNKYTKSDKVNVKFDVGRAVKKFKLTNAVGCETEADWLDIPPQKTVLGWNLVFSGNPAKATVYAKFQDILGRYSDCLSSFILWKEEENSENSENDPVLNCTSQGPGYLWYNSGCRQLSSLDNSECSSLNGSDYVWLTANSQCRKLDSLSESECPIQGQYYWKNSACMSGEYFAGGDLDTDFANSGRYIQHNLAGGNQNDDLNAIAVQNDGKVFLVGSSKTASKFDALAMRLNADGSLDTSFNGTGTWIRDGENAGSNKNNNHNCIVVQDDGKIVVGSSGSASTPYNQPRDMAVYRLNPDGTLDTSFSEDGVFSENFGQGSNQKNDTINACAPQADGKIIFAGYAMNGSSQLQIALWRLNSDGSLDTTFDGDGFRMLDNYASNSSVINDVKVQSDGKIIVTGKQKTTDDDIFVDRFNSDGSDDSSFASGTGGKYVIDFGEGNDSGSNIALLNNHYLITGTARNSDGNNDGVVIKILHDGSGLDNSFNSNGFKRFSSVDFGGVAGSARLTGIVSHSDGRTSIAGSFKSNSGNDSAVVIRIKEDGSFDNSFSNGDGIFTDDGGDPDNHTARNAKIDLTKDGNGNLYLSSSTYNNSDRDVYVVKIK